MSFKLNDFIFLLKLKLLLEKVFFKYIITLLIDILTYNDDVMNELKNSRKVKRILTKIIAMYRKYL